MATDTPTDTPPLLGAKGLDEATRAVLVRRILSLADSKRLMGIRYSDWVLGAPSLESNIATSSMAQDEWGHARLIYALLKALGRNPKPIERDRPADQYASISSLDHELMDWAEVVGAIILIDGALTTFMTDIGTGSYEPARARIPKMVTEEEFHRDLGKAWYRRLARATEESRSRLTEVTLAQLPVALAWLNPGDGSAETLADVAIVGKGDNLVERYKSSVRDLVALLGIDVDSVEPALDNWDSARGRGPGQPDEEAVQRARGDLNRDLFVE